MPPKRGAVSALEAITGAGGKKAPIDPLASFKPKKKKKAEVKDNLSPPATSLAAGAAPTGGGRGKKAGVASGDLRPAHFGSSAIHSPPAPVPTAAVSRGGTPESRSSVASIGVVAESKGKMRRRRQRGAAPTEAQFSSAQDQMQDHERATTPGDRGSTSAGSTRAAAAQAAQLARVRNKRGGRPQPGQSPYAEEQQLVTSPQSSATPSDMRSPGSEPARPPSRSRSGSLESEGLNNVKESFHHAARRQPAGQDAVNIDRRASVGATYAAKQGGKRGGPHCDSEGIIMQMQESGDLTVEMLFDPQSDLSSPRVLAYVMKQNYSLLSVLILNCFRIKSIKTRVTEVTVQQLVSSYHITLPEQYTRGSVPAGVICDAVRRLPMQQLEGFVDHTFKLSGLALHSGLVSKPVFASYLLKYSLGHVWDELMATRSVAIAETRERFTIVQDEAGTPELPLPHAVWHTTVIKPNLAAAKVQRCWKCRAARREITRRIFMRKHRVCAEASDEDDDDGDNEDGGGGGFKKTWRSGRGGAADAALDSPHEQSRKELLTWISIDSLVKLCMESTFLLCAMLCRTTDVASPLTVLESRHVLWLQRAYNIEGTPNTTLYRVCRAVKARKESVVSVLDDALRLADIEKQYNGISSQALLKLLGFFDCLASLAAELRQMGIPAEPVLNGVFYLLAKTHKEHEGREFIAKEHAYGLSLLLQRSKSYAVSRGRALKAQIKIKNALQNRVVRPLTDYKTDKEIMLYGDASDYDCIITCQAWCRRFLARKRFQHTLRHYSAAKRIQRHWRHIVARQRFLHLLTLLQAQRLRAALVIQRRVRGFTAKRSFEQAKARVVRAQAIGRGCIGRCNIAKYIASCSVLQRVGRACSIRAGLRGLSLGARARVIQRAWRRLQFQRTLVDARCRVAGVRGLQRVGRAAVGRARLRDLLATLTIQRFGRAAVCRRLCARELLRPHAAAVAIQREWRKARYREDGRRREAAEQQQHAALRIQCLHRQKHARARVRERRGELLRARAALTIQCAARCRAARDRRRERERLAALGRRAVEVQAFARVLSSRRVACERRRRLQARDHYASLDAAALQRCRDAASAIQRAYRCRLARRAVAARRVAVSAARALKRVGRGWLARAALHGAGTRRGDGVQRLQRVGRGRRGRAAAACVAPARALQRAGRGLGGRRAVALGPVSRPLQRVGRGAAGRARARKAAAAASLARVARGFAARRFLAGADDFVGVGDALIVGPSLQVGGVGGPGLPSAQMATLLKQAEIGRRALRRAVARLQSCGRAALSRADTRGVHACAVRNILVVQAAARSRLSAATVLRGRAAAVVAVCVRSAVAGARVQLLRQARDWVRKGRGGHWALQRAGRGFLERRRLKRVSVGVPRLQAAGRAAVERRVLATEHAEKKQAAEAMQRAWRLHGAKSEAEARRHMRTMSRRIARVFTGYAARLTLLTRTQRAAKTLQRAGRGLRQRVEARGAKRRRNVADAAALMLASEQTARRSFFTRWKLWMETTVSRRLRRSANSNLANRLLLLTEHRAQQRCLDALKRRVLYARTARGLQRVGRGAADRSLTHDTLRLTAAARRTLSNVARGYRGRASLRRVDAGCLRAVTAAAAMLFTTWRCGFAVAAAHLLVRETATVVRRTAFARLQAHATWAKEQRRRTQVLRHLLSRSEEVRLELFYAKLEGWRTAQMVCVADFHALCSYLFPPRHRRDDDAWKLAARRPKRF